MGTSFKILLMQARPCIVCSSLCQNHKKSEPERDHVQVLKGGVMSACLKRAQDDGTKKTKWDVNNTAGEGFSRKKTLLWTKTGDY